MKKTTFGKNILLSILFSKYCFVFAQPVVTGNSLLVKPYLHLGDTRIYKVKIEAKTEDPPYVFSRSEQEYEVQFTVVDTAGGYTILYKPRMIQATDKKWLQQSLTAKISNGIEVLYRISYDGKIVEYINIEKVQKLLVNAMDSVKSYNQFSRDDSAAVEQFSRSLYTINGVENCLQPMLLFNGIFNMPAFRPRADYTPGFRVNLFLQPNIPGVLITSLKKIDQPHNSAKLEAKFVGNPDSAARLMNPFFTETYETISGKKYKGYLPLDVKNNDETDYEVELSSGCIVSMRKKLLIRHLFRTVFKISMELISSR